MNPAKPYFARNPNQKQFIDNQRRLNNGEKVQKNGNGASPIDSHEIPQITDEDAALLDQHDSFYATTKSLLVLFQLMGIMPIMRVPKDVQSLHRTTYKWISTATFWAYFIWGLESIIVVMVGNDRLALFLTNSDKRFDEIIYNIIFLSILIPHFLLPVASWRHGPQVAIFKNMWTTYQFSFDFRSVCISSIVSRTRCISFKFSTSNRTTSPLEEHPGRILKSFNNIRACVRRCMKVDEAVPGQNSVVVYSLWQPLRGNGIKLKYFKITGEPIVFPNLYTLTWGLCAFSWSFSASIIISQYYLQPDFAFWHTFAYYHILAMLNGFCSLWYINCNAFGTASRGLARNLHKALQSDHPSKKLAEYRHLWMDLSHMMQQLGRAYSNMYGIYCLVIFFTTIMAVYGSLSEILEHGLSYKEMGLFVLGVYCMGLLFIICNEAYHASMKVGQDFQERLLNVNLSVVDHRSQKEVEMFLVAIAKNPPIMNLDGYTNINRELFTTNVSFLATYLVVLMQFKLTLLRGAGKAKDDPTPFDNSTAATNH